MSSQGTIRRFTLIIEKIKFRKCPSFSELKDYLNEHSFEISNTYSFIASDTPITSYSQKKSSKEPDILMMEPPKMFDNPLGFAANPSGELSSMVIFEFKRPGETAHNKKKNDFRWEYSELGEKYFDDFIYGDNKKNYRGRTVVLGKDTPKFGYVIVDVIPTKLKEYNISKGFKKTPFGTFYRINPELNLHIEVITFEQLLAAVESRHAPFFDKLFNEKNIEAKSTPSLLKLINE